MKRHWNGALALIGLIAVVVAACGGGAEPTATPPPTPTTAAPTPTPPPGATATPISLPSPTPTAALPTRTPIPPPATPTATPVGLQPAYGGIVRNRALSDLTTWDVYEGGAGTAAPFQNVFSNIILFDSLKPSAAGLRPDVAERWEQSADGKTVTFFLRKDVQWHDGKPLTAADVAWNLERGQRAEGQATVNKKRLQNVASIETPDSSTVRINLKQPSGSFLANMAVPYVLLYAPHGVSPATSEFRDAAKAIGSGPFKMKAYIKDVRYDFVRNEKYYKKDEAGRALPFLDGVTSFIIVSPAAGLAAFRVRQLDCGCYFDHDFLTDQQEFLERQIPGVKLEVVNSALFHLFFNNREPFTDQRIRKAIYIGLDRLYIRNLVRGGRGFYPPTVLLAPDLGGQWGLPTAEMLKIPGFRVKDGKKDPADLELSRQLFKEAGVDPATITVNLMWPSVHADSAEIMDAALKAVGVKVNLRILGGTESANALRTGQFDISQLTGANVFDDPSDQPPRYLLSDGPENWGKWQRPEIDAFYLRMDSELDSAKRLQLAYEFQRQVIDEAAASPLRYNVATRGTHAHVFGFVGGAFTTHSGMRLERLWIDKRLA